MAIDTTPPRLKLIVTIAIIVVITLVAVNFALTSYFAIMTDTAAREKIAPTTDRDEQEKAEAAALTNASIPLEKAMEMLSKGARPESIAPQQSDDLGAMTGWIRMPKPAPTPVPAAPAAPEGDAGTATDADAEATPAAPETTPAPPPAPAPRPELAPTVTNGAPTGQPAAAEDAGAGQNAP